MKPGKRYIIGLGNPQRGDDAAGRIVARQLRCKVDNAVHIIEHDGEAAALIEWLSDADMVILIDAACSDTDPPGFIRCIDANDGPLPANLFNLSSHGLGLAAAIELARAMGKLPATCLVYSIEGKQFDLGRPVSSTVHDAIQQLELIILQELGYTLDCGQNHA